MEREDCICFIMLTGKSAYRCNFRKTSGKLLEIFFNFIYKLIAFFFILCEFYQRNQIIIFSFDFLPASNILFYCT